MKCDLAAVQKALQAAERERDLAAARADATAEQQERMIEQLSARLSNHIREEERPIRAGIDKERL